MINVIVGIIFMLLFIAHCLVVVECYGKLQHFCLYIVHKNKYSYTIIDRLCLIAVSLFAPLIGIIICHLTSGIEYIPKYDFTLIGKTHDKIDFQLIDLSKSKSVWKCGNTVHNEYMCKNDKNRCMLCDMVSYYK